MQHTPVVEGVQALAKHLASHGKSTTDLEVKGISRAMEMRIFGICPKLESLTLRECTKLEPKHLVVLQGLVAFRHLSIRNCPALVPIVSDEAWADFRERCVIDFSHYPGARDADQIVSFKEVRKVGELARALHRGKVQVVIQGMEQMACPGILDADGWGLLHHVATCDCEAAQLVDKLLSGGALADVKNVKGHTALCLAAGRRKLEVVRALLRGGADPNLRVDDYSPLFSAVASKSEGAGVEVEIVNTLIEAGAEVDALFQAPLEPRPGIDPALARDNNSTILCFLAGKGDLEIARALLDAGANANGPEGLVGMPPTFHAALWGHEAMLALLLEKGASLEKMIAGNNILHMAAIWKKTEVVRFLIGQGMSPSVKGVEGNQPLHACAMTGDVESAAILIEAGAPLDQETDEKVTPLHLAADRGHAAMVAFLVEQGASIDYACEDGVTPLIRAVVHKRKEAAEVLLAKGATFEEAGLLDALAELEVMVEVPVLGQIPMLYLSAYRGNVAAVKHYVGKGLSVTSKNEAGLTLLHVAALGGQVPMIDWLCEQKVQVDDWDAQGRPPLRYAILGKSTQAAERLLQLGAAPDAADGKKVCALHEAALTGEAPLVRLLLLHGATVDLQEENGLSALHLAAQRNFPLVAAELKQKGIPIDGTDSNGSTALHWAALKGNQEMAEWLLGQKAAVDARDSSQRTPLYRAAERGHVQLVELLVTRGAEVDAIDQDGVTPLLIARHAGHQHVVEKLLAEGAQDLKSQKCVVC